MFLSGYDAAVDKPFEANAMQASLFEVQALLKHYVPSVSSLTKVFESPLNKQAYDLEVGWEGDTSTRQGNPLMSHSLTRPACACVFSPLPRTRTTPCLPWNASAD